MKISDYILTGEKNAKRKTNALLPLCVENPLVPNGICGLKSIGRQLKKTLTECMEVKTND